MAFTAKIFSWRFHHLNIVGCLLKRRPTKGRGTPPGYCCMMGWGASLCPPTHHTNDRLRASPSFSSDLVGAMHARGSGKAARRVSPVSRHQSRAWPFACLAFCPTDYRNVFIIGYETFSLGCYMVCCSVASLAVGYIYLSCSHLYSFASYDRPYALKIKYPVTRGFS